MGLVPTVTGDGSPAIWEHPIFLYATGHKATVLDDECVRAGPNTNRDHDTMPDDYPTRNRLSLIPRWSQPSQTTTEMARNIDDDADEPPVSAVLASLDDEKCRAVLTALREPKSATELQAECELASSTVYRKLERLRESALVKEYTEVRRDGPNATLYERDFTDISISIDDDEAFRVAIERPDEEPDAPEDRMATFWSEMKKES